MSAETPAALAGLGAATRSSRDAARQLGRCSASSRATRALRRACASRARAVEAHLADSLVALELDELRARARSRTSALARECPARALAVALPQLRGEPRREPGAQVRVSGGAAARRGDRQRNRRLRAGGGVARGARQARRGERAGARAAAGRAGVRRAAAAGGGMLVDWRGRRERDEEQAAARAAAQLGLEPARRASGRALSRGRGTYTCTFS